MMMKMIVKGSLHPIPGLPRFRQEHIPSVGGIILAKVIILLFFFKKLFMTSFLLFFSYILRYGFMTLKEPKYHIVCLATLNKACHDCMLQAKVSACVSSHCQQDYRTIVSVFHSGNEVHCS